MKVRLLWLFIGILSRVDWIGGVITDDELAVLIICACSSRNLLIKHHLNSESTMARAQLALKGNGRWDSDWFIARYAQKTPITSADPRLLGALRKTVSGGEGLMRMDETHLSVFHSVSNRACGKRSRNSISSAARINSRFFCFLSKSKRLDDIHVTWFGWFLRRERDSAPH